ncbi:MAG: hypothetical protein GY711_31210 [bacterium]|nr:hypothetical protein [bacterium]
MRVKIFTFRYSATLGGFDETPLQEFARDKEVLAFREHFFTLNDVPHFACVMTWQDRIVPAGETAEAPFPRRNKPDPTAELSESDRILFNTLREWRAARAREDGLPQYVVFTNRQLVEIVKRKPDSTTALTNISGIGPKKVQRYGAALLEMITPAPADA